MPLVTLRFYAELNDFLPPERRQRDWARPIPGPAPARHLIETCGVPHTEVELILRGGESIGLDAPVEEGDRLAVYPMFETFDVRPLLRLRPRPLRRPRFLADAHLGALARRLRLLGFDTLWHNDWGDQALARLAAEEQRILLTRDRQLLMRQAVTHGCYLRSASTAAQLSELIQRLQLCAEIAPFTRCTLCNGSLEAASAQEVGAQLPPRVAERQRELFRCGGCGRLYWKGTHWQAMWRQIESICPGAPGAPAALAQAGSGALGQGPAVPVERRGSDRDLDIQVLDEHE
ncbi:MAG: Mut7-C RNAse domain-containing protein [Bdellovibrio bacteriovorus]